MNAKLRKLPDGAGRDTNVTGEVVWFNLSHTAGRGYKDFGEIYWPFALHFVVGSSDNDYDDHYRVTHLPTGRAVTDVKDRVTGMRLVRRLRSLPVDWEFTNVKSEKYRGIVPIIKPVIMSYSLKT